jgi:hypothetical protein
VQGFLITLYTLRIRVCVGLFDHPVYAAYTRMQGFLITLYPLRIRICAGLFQPVRGGTQTGMCSLLTLSFGVFFFFIFFWSSGKRARQRVFGGADGRRQLASYCLSRVRFIQNLNSRFNMVVFVSA